MNKTFCKIIYFLFIVSCINNLGTSKEKMFKIQKVLHVDRIKITQEYAKEKYKNFKAIKHHEELREAITLFINSILRKDSDTVLELFDDKGSILISEAFSDEYGEHITKKDLINDFKRRGPMYLRFFDPEGYLRYQKKRGKIGSDLEKSLYEILEQAVKNNIRIVNAYPSKNFKTKLVVNVIFLWEKAIWPGPPYYELSFEYNEGDERWYLIDLTFMFQ